MSQGSHSTFSWRMFFGVALVRMLLVGLYNQIAINLENMKTNAAEAAEQ